MDSMTGCGWVSRQLWRGVSWAALAWCGSMWALSAVHATAIWEARVPDQLRLPSVSVGNSGVLDVRVRMGPIQSWATQSTGQRENRYDATTGLLTVAEVVALGTSYYNVVLTPAEVLSLGAWRSTTTRKVKVIGDSLADGGTFGFKLTVQGTASAPAQIWTDHIAAALAAPTLCPRYKGVSEEEVALNPDPTYVNCTSFAVGGGRIHPMGVLNRSFSSSPFSLTQQMRDLAAADAYADNDVLLMVGGGNDAADLLGAYIKADSDKGVLFGLLLSEVLGTSDTLKVLSRGRDGRIEGGHWHMQALANRLVDHMKPDVLDKGAKRVVVLNMPDVSRTPKFAALLAQRNDAATLSSTTSAWVKSYNQQLQSRLAAYADRVIVLDFFSLLNGWLDQPGSFDLTDTHLPACPSTGTDGNGLPKYNLAKCSESRLPPGWEGHVFADDFHGTPRVNRLLADAVLQAMQLKGWR